MRQYLAAHQTPSYARRLRENRATAWVTGGDVEELFRRLVAGACPFSVSTTGHPTPTLLKEALTDEMTGDSLGERMRDLGAESA